MFFSSTSSWSDVLKALKLFLQSLMFRKPFLCGSSSENSLSTNGSVRLSPSRAYSASRKALNLLNWIFAEFSDALLKLSLMEGYLREITSPICWIAENFQSKVLVAESPPPSDLLMLFVIPLTLVSLYGFEFAMSL